MKKRDLTIVMYHYVREISNSRYERIKGLEKDDFIEQIHYLNKNYRIVRMEDVIGALNNNDSLPPRAAILTFDDGYSDHFETVYPILKNMKLQGSFYPPVRALKEKSVLNVNKIHYILCCEDNINYLIQRLHALMDMRKEEFDLLSPIQYFNKHAVANRFDTKEIIYFKRMLQVVLPKALRDEIASILFDEVVDVDEEVMSRELYMSDDQIKCLVNTGMHVGSHGYDHFWLDSLTYEEQLHQIKESKEFLKNVGADMNNWTMCYPFGAYNQSTVEILKESGCQLALTTKVDRALLTESNRYSLERLDTNDFPKDRYALETIEVAKSL